MVDDKTPGKVQENAPRDHVRELSLAEHPFVARPPVDMQRDDVDRFEEFFQRRTMFCIAHGQLVGGVVEPDRHAERFGEDRELRADIAVADDTEAPAAHLVAPLGRFIPDPFVHLAGFVREPPLERNYLGYDELDNAARIGKGSVENGRPVGTRTCKVYLVRPDTKSAHRQQVRHVPHRYRSRRGGDDGGPAGVLGVHVEIFLIPSTSTCAKRSSSSPSDKALSEVST